MMCRPEPFIGKGQLDKLGQSMLRGLCLSFNFFIIQNLQTAKNTPLADPTANNSPQVCLPIFLLPLYFHTNYPNSKKGHLFRDVLNRIWQRPIFPIACAISIVGAEGLNYCVRNENRWNPFAIVTRNGTVCVNTLTTA